MLVVVLAVCLMLKNFAFKKLVPGSAVDFTTGISVRFFFASNLLNKKVKSFRSTLASILPW